MQSSQQRVVRSHQGLADMLGSQHATSWQHEPSLRLNRGSERRHSYFRCGRFFTVGHEWYVSVREGRDLGPYTTRYEARMALACHVTTCFVGASGHIGQLDAHGERDATMLEVLVQELASCREQARLRNENSAYIWAQQRLEELDEHPEDHDHADVRASALRYFLFELDSV